MGNLLSQPISKAQLDEMRKNLKLGNERVDLTSPNARLVQKNVMDAFNYRRLDVLRRFASPDCFFFIQGADQGIPFDAFVDELVRMHASFPDIAMTFQSIQEVQPGEVVIASIRSHGTHTGEPYQFGPYPAIPRTDKECGSRFALKISVTKGKMTRCFVEVPDGELMGPANYYLQIGGTIA